MKDGKKYILIADDDDQIRHILRILLTGEGYAVTEAANGVQAAEAAAEDIDLYLLDVQMPLCDGIAAAEQIRRRFDAPIVFLTAYGGESDKVMGFSVGADDYIVKPFSNAELLMRLRAILRRAAPSAAPSAPPHHLPMGDAVLDTHQQVVIKDGETIPLTHTEYSILHLLATNRKKIFSPDHLYESIWNDNAVGNDTIMVHIKNIRKKLGDSSRNAVYIKTAWGRGYYID